MYWGNSSRGWRDGSLCRFIGGTFAGFGARNDRFAICGDLRWPKNTFASYGKEGEYGRVRYRSLVATQCLHPTIPVHTPLIFDILDGWSQRSIGGCTYHVSHPAGRNYETFPVNALEAEARRVARFYQTGHTPGEGERSTG